MSKQDKLLFGIYLDTYAELLTYKQRSLMQMYYNEDLSLGEIAESLNISRQAVHYSLSLAEKQIMKYEDILSLVKKKNIILHEIDELKQRMISSEQKKSLDRIEETILQ